MGIFSQSTPLYFPVEGRQEKASLDEALADIRLMPEALLDGGIVIVANSSSLLHVREPSSRVREFGSGPEIAFLLAGMDVPVAGGRGIVYRKVSDDGLRLRVRKYVNGSTPSFIISGLVSDPRSRRLYFSSNRSFHYRYAIIPLQSMDLREVRM